MTNSTYYSLDNGDLRISSADPPYEWRGRPDGLVVLDLQVAAERDWALVLLEPAAGSGTVHNLVKVGSDAEVIWRAELPSEGLNDWITGFILQTDGAISASTWSGYRVQISSESGKLLDSRFSK